MKPQTIIKTTLAIALFFSLSLGGQAQTVLRLAYAENSQPIKDALHFLGREIEEKPRAKSRLPISRTVS